MAGDGTYQGWRSYETWVINLWLRDDPDSLASLYATARAAGDRYTFAKHLKEALELEAVSMVEGAVTSPTINGIFSDLLQHSLDCADFEEIADHVFEELEDEGEEIKKAATVADLRRRYHQAVEAGEESFSIEGLEFLTSYAKYVLQFFEMNNIPDSDKLRDRIQPQGEEGR